MTPTEIVWVWCNADASAELAAQHAAQHGRLREYIADTLCRDAGSLFAAAMITTALDAVDWAELEERLETDNEEWYEDADCADCGAVENAGTVEHAHGADMRKPRRAYFFELGAICCTPGADEALTAAGVDIMDLLARHAQLDPGDLPPADVRQNLHSLESDGRIFSAYTVNGTRFWVITEWDRSCTTVLLPSEY